ncbi:unnamed protein product [Rotaria sp. Silwood1]|nr:unnamed protein product [Rotaria sp. Silwood1]CAF0737682.1 unnamed protein product [Rotaria sp. Silwood1]CAF3345001.1 unnamed protein product [Rotaria sp. Silwood1]CAF4549345.1 unnamed protein product [Rotaria sp. Silwood1]
MATTTNSNNLLLPMDIQQKLQELELELAEGDITQKGFEKKRTKLLAPYQQQLNETHVGNNMNNNNNNEKLSNRQSKIQCRRQKRDGYNRYHSDVRQEAVKQALEQFGARPIPSSKRIINSQTKHESSDDEDDDGESSSTYATTDDQQNKDSSVSPVPIPIQNHHYQNPPSVELIIKNIQAPPPPSAFLSDFIHRSQEPSLSNIECDLTRSAGARYRDSNSDYVNTSQQHYVLYGDRNASIDLPKSITNSINHQNEERKPSLRVSSKILALVNTLKVRHRPKRKPMKEYYEDNEEELAIPPIDPLSPKPEGGISVPSCGEQLIVSSQWPKTFLAALQQHASQQPRTNAITILDEQTKPSQTLTFLKLLTRSQKIAYNLLHKVHSHGNTGSNSRENLLKTGDRVALVYSSNDPINFICAFYGCLLAGMVPLPIDVPLARRDWLSQRIGILLGQLSIKVALTSDSCYRQLPKVQQHNSSSSSANINEIISFKGWPNLIWFITEHLPKPPKDWTINDISRSLCETTPAYIEYTSVKDGSIVGVTINYEQLFVHTQTLVNACKYSSTDICLCCVDFKRQIGLWHTIHANILSGMQVIFIPTSILKSQPSSWLLSITKYHITTAIVRSRDMHWAVLSLREMNNISSTINLSSLRLLIISDGSNPWSLTAVDTFLSTFMSRGLRSDCCCPCSYSSETLTLSIRRQYHSSSSIHQSGRGILSMHALSYGVVRVDQDNSLTSLTIQDVGHVLPGAIIGIVKIDGPPLLCQTDEIGEVVISSKATPNGYWALPGLSTNIFKVIPLGSDERPIGTQEFVRSGLLGFLGPGGLLFVTGSREGLMQVAGRKHNSDDLIATALAVEPMKVVYRARVVIFSIRVLRDERIIIVAEQRPDIGEDECFQWMSRVLQAIDSIHQVGIYCLALCPANTLPKTHSGTIHVQETRRRLLEGNLHPCSVLMCPHSCILNLPKPREHHPEREVGPGAILAGTIIQGMRLAEAKGTDMIFTDDQDTSDQGKKLQYIDDILRWRSITMSDHVLYSVINAKGQESASVTCSAVHKRCERIALTILERIEMKSSDHIALLYPPCVDLVSAFYACLYIDVVPVAIRPPHAQNLLNTLSTVKMMVELSKAKVILTNSSIAKLLRCKEAASLLDPKLWPLIIDTDDLPKQKKNQVLPKKSIPTQAQSLCYLDFSISTTGSLTAVKLSYGAVANLCRSIKLSCELYPSREIVLCLDPYNGLGLALWCIISVYAGHHSILIDPAELELNPSVWMNTISHYKIRDTFCSYSVMELSTKGLSTSIVDLKNRGLSLSCVRTCAVVAEERPRLQLLNSFIKLFQTLGLNPRTVSTTFGCRVNIAICLRGASDPDPAPVYVDQRALRNDRVTLVEKGSPHSLCLLESGKLLPGVKVVIANPESKGQCADAHLGELWVQSGHNSLGCQIISYGDNHQHHGSNHNSDQFYSHLATGDTRQLYARTGYLGFVRRTDSIAADGKNHDAVYIVGSLEETLLIRGMRYHPIDIENTVMRTHKRICECACFTWTNLLVVVVEYDGLEQHSLDLVPLITSAILEEHYVIVGVLVIVDPGVVPVNSRGEKQRMHLRDGFVSDQLDPIFVAYNM